MNWFLNDMEGILNMLSFAFNSVTDYFVGLWYDGTVKFLILYLLSLFFFLFGVLFVLDFIYLEKSKWVYITVIILFFVLSLFFFIYTIYHFDTVLSSSATESVSDGDFVLYLMSGKGVFI